MTCRPCNESPAVVLRCLRQSQSDCSRSSGLLTSRRNEAATQAALFELDGERFFRTGDLGYMDDEGYFSLVDRLKRMINASGYKVWPAEVETQMYRHPAIQEVCVIAAKDGRRGETVSLPTAYRSRPPAKCNGERYKKRQWHARETRAKRRTARTQGRESWRREHPIRPQ